MRTADDTVNVLVKAIKSISKGQEITNSYQPGVIHRPDMSLYIYGAPAEKKTGGKQGRAGLGWVLEGGGSEPLARDGQ